MLRRLNKAALASLIFGMGCGSSGGVDTGDPGPGVDSSVVEHDGGSDTTAATDGASESSPSDGSGETAGPECTTNSDCEAKLPTTTPPNCAVAKCAATTRKCAFEAVDKDGDGYKTSVCSATGAAITGGDDCNDDDPSIYPGAWDGPEVTGKQPNRCDKKDNDCNGSADDAKDGARTCECDPAKDIDVTCSTLSDGTSISWPTGTPTGSCKAGKKTCAADGKFGPCTGAVTPKATDACTTGNDDNCNGTPNEGCSCVAGTTSTCATVYGAKGTCAAGSVVCGADGKFPACPIVPKATDSCGAGNDDNCNGKVNDGCTCVTGTSSTCAAVYGARGTCAGGTLTCGVDGKWPACPIAPKADTCASGNDDSCNGAANEGCGCISGATRSCGGPCTVGSQSCSAAGAWGACFGSVGQSTYYRDADGDGYCTSLSTLACSTPSGYRPSGCSADCNDANPYTSACSGTTSATWYGSYSKPWKGFGNCGSSYPTAACGAGQHVCACTVARTSGGGTVTDIGPSGGQCGVQICDNGFESASADVTTRCCWN